MAASYPGAIVTLPTHSDNTDTIFAADINTPNAEIVAVETGLLNGFQHDLVPLTDDAKSLGNSSHRWLKAWLQDIDLDGTLTFNGQVIPSIGIVVNGLCNGRLTLTSATPVTTADVTGATTIYFTPYGGKYIALYDGVSAWATVSFSEISIAVPATTSQMYDVFVYSNSGTATLELLAWTNDTTRATALVLQDGVLVKSGATTRRYVGSFRTTTVSGQTEDSYAKRYLFNYYNSVQRPLRGAIESTDSWTYTLATIRQANANTANQVDVVVGISENAIDVRVNGMFSNAGGSKDATVAIGEDSTTTRATGCLSSYVKSGSAGDFQATTATLVTIPAVGRHFYTWLESAQAISTTTWYGDNGSPATIAIQSGISGTWRA